jgi:hypothetical protein
MKESVILREFKPSELLFDEDETKDILKFFFTNYIEFIDGLVVTDRLRGFAQGVLVEAVDATYAIGFAKIIFDILYLKPPKPKVRKFLAKLSRKAATHWFKHARATDLSSVKIYDSVRETISNAFRSDFLGITNDLAENKPLASVIAYRFERSNRTIWG